MPAPDVDIKVDGLMVVAGLAAVAVGYAWYRADAIGDSVADAADEVGGAVNPADRRNLINRSFNWWYGTITGSDGTLGGDLADWTSPGWDTAGEKEQQETTPEPEIVDPNRGYDRGMYNTRRYGNG